MNAEEKPAAQSKRVSSPPVARGAVFLSYASQDAVAAARIATALRAAGIEVWFDESELRGGDVWDQRIRREIQHCALFMPVISHHTQERLEGYFRLEWKLAVDRSHLMAVERSFLVPVVIDGTRDQEALVPDVFRAVQWTRLPAGETPATFVGRLQHLLSLEASATIRTPASAVSEAVPIRQRQARISARANRALSVGVAAVFLAALAFFAIDRPWISEPAAAAVFAPPPHSIAVLPFVNMSGDREQEYFSDGLTEELLNSLTRINELQVAARTSSFAFKGKEIDIGTIARKLNVGALLEGSVRRSGHTIRVTAQLINAVTGFDMWSQTYDYDLGDVLKLQTEIATAVAAALKVTLLGDISQKIELGGTRKPAAFDAYLRGMMIGRTGATAAQGRAAIAAYTEAVRLDPGYALAFAERSIELTNYAEFEVYDPAAAREVFERALTDARTATRLAPDLAEAYYALGVALETGSLDFAQSDEAYTRAMTLAPGSARILAAYSRESAEMGRTAVAITAGRRAIALDPLNFHVHRMVGIGFLLSRQYADALAAFQTAITLQPDYVRDIHLRGEVLYEMGDYEAARKSCEVAPADELSGACLALTYRKLGRNADAEAALRSLQAIEGNSGAYDYATVYAQWGEVSQALDWLDTAVRLRDSGLVELKAEPDLDPLREEPRFQAIERGLKFPD
jgi:TolB-like protein/cytochrome c-type biogenesis protein CcmH/NrfG